MKGSRPWSLRAWGVLTAVVFLAIVVLPMGSAFWHSLRDETGWTLRAYGGVLGQARQWSLLRNSLTIAGGTALCASALGVGVAFALEYLRVPTRRAMVYAVAAPFLIPSYVSAVAWIDILGTNGLLHNALQGMFGWDVAPPSVSTRAGIVFVSALSYYPVVALTTALALRRFDRRLEEAACLAASQRRTLRAVVLPLLAPSIVTGALIVFLLTLVGFAVPSLLQVNVYPVEIFTTFSAFYDFAAATAQSLPLIACGVGALLLGAFYIGPRRAWLGGAARMAGSGRGTTAQRAAAMVACWALILVSAVLPLAVLVWRSLPLRSYAEVFATAKDEIATSLVISAVSATVITILAFSLAYLRRRRRGFGFPQAASFLGLLPFLVSGPVIGVALIATWNRPGLPALVYDSVLVLVFACAARFLFFAERGFGAALADIEASVEEAAHVFGVPWWRQVTGILLPLLWPAVVGLWGLTFVLCMGELDATALVCPPGATPLPVRVFSLMHYGPGRLVAALSVITVGVILACAALTATLYAKGRRVRDARC